MQEDYCLLHYICSVIWYMLAHQHNGSYDFAGSEFYLCTPNNTNGTRNILPLFLLHIMSPTPYYRCDQIDPDFHITFKSSGAPFTNMV